MTKLYRKAAPKVSDKPVTEARLSIYDEVTATIIRQLEAGCAPWVKPWSAKGGTAVMPMNGVSGRRYSGVNVLLLWGSMMERGYSSPLFMTYKQAADLGGCVRKGEKATHIVYADRFIPAAEKTRAAEENRDARGVPFLKRFCVFNVEQIEGLPASFYADETPPSPVEQYGMGEALIAASGATLRIGGNKAFYSPLVDFVQVPPIQAFADPLDYYRTATHELCHWTGHPSRLSRNLLNTFGSKDYAREELVAEMGAAFTCAGIGINPTMRHADYLASWLKVLREDNRAIFKAASMASKASDFLLSKLDGYRPDTDPDKAPVPVADPVPASAPVEAAPEPVREPEPVAVMPEPVAPPVEAPAPVMPDGIKWPSPHKSPEAKAEWTRRFHSRQAAWKAGFDAFEAGKPRVAFAYLRTIPVADHGEALPSFVQGWNAAKENASAERQALRATGGGLFAFDFGPRAPEPMPEPLGPETGRRSSADGVPVRVHSRPASAVHSEAKRRLALAMSGQVEWAPVEGLPGLSYTAPEGAAKPASEASGRRVAVALVLSKDAKRYYRGGHRMVVSGVPVRMARKPATRHHADMLRESLREPCRA